MTDAVSTSFVIKYKPGSQDSGSRISVKIDPDKHSSNTIPPGEDVYFRVYANCDYKIILSDSKSSTTDEGIDSEEVSERVSFVQTKEQNLSHVYLDHFSYIQIGESPENITINPPNVGDLKITLDTVTDINEFAAIFDFTYDTDYDLHKLTPSEAKDGFAITVLIIEI